MSVCRPQSKVRAGGVGTLCVVVGLSEFEQLKKSSFQKGSSSREKSDAEEQLCLSIGSNAPFCASVEQILLTESQMYSTYLRVSRSIITIMLGH